MLLEECMFNAIKMFGQLAIKLLIAAVSGSENALGPL
jgi:hypothetical protein